MPKKAPPLTASAAEHKKHGDEFLAEDENKDPKKVNKPEYKDMTDPVEDHPDQV